jgi:DNA primase
MLKASTLAARRKLELRVVPLRAGTDPAELIAGEGAEAMHAAVESSVPFVRFRVERGLADGDAGTPEGRDRILAGLRPVFATVPPSAMRLELTRMVAGALELPESLAEQLLSQRGGGRETQGGAVAGAEAGGSPRRVSSRREESERAFLALCIALPDSGERALSELDLDEHFSGTLLRAAARTLRDGGLRDPMAAVDARDPGEGGEDGGGLRSLLAELVVEAGGLEPHPAMLEVQRLQLELARLDRHIQQARGREDADVTGLATRRGQVKHDFDAAYARVLEETGAREG